MSKCLICVTNRSLCPDDFLDRLALIAKAKPHAIILREKDLSYDDYLTLARNVQTLCVPHGVSLLLNWREPIVRLENCGLQLSYTFRDAAITTESVPYGISIHSPEEAATLRDNNASWLLAGHIYSTTCKPGIAPRGTKFLENICRLARQPVYAIGGIQPERVPEVLAAGAAGYCVMSPLMTHPAPDDLIYQYEEYEGVSHE